MKKITTIILVLSMIFSSGITMHTQSDIITGDNYIEDDVFLSHAEVELGLSTARNADGMVGTSSDSGLFDLFEQASLDLSGRSRNFTSFPQLRNLDFVIEEGNFINFEVELLLCEDNKLLLSSSGKVYTIDEVAPQKRDGVASRNRVYLMYLHDTNEYRFVQVRINVAEDGSAIKSVILQNILTEELFYFESSVSDYFVFAISSIAHFTDEDRFRDLFIVKNRLITPIETPELKVSWSLEYGYFSMEAIVKGTNENIVSQLDIDRINAHLANDFAGMDFYGFDGIAPMNAPFTAWRDFFNDLRRWGNTQLSWWNIDRHIISPHANDLNRWQQIQCYQYNLYSFVFSNGPFERVAEVLWVGITPQVRNMNSHAIQVEVLEAVTLTQDTRSLNRVDVRFWAGPTVFNIWLTLHKNSNANPTQVYTTRTINGVFDSRPSTFQTVVGLTRAGSIFSAWQHMADSAFNDLGVTQIMDDTYQGQVNRWGQSGAVRAIQGRSSNSGTLRRPGERMNMTGNIYNGRSGNIQSSNYFTSMSVRR